MIKATVSKTFSPKKYKDNKLAVKGENILKSLENNPHFPGIDAKLDELRSKLKEYKNALAKTLDGGKLTTVIKNNCRRDLEETLKTIAEYVQITSDGDAGAISSSGFDTHKKPSRIGLLDKPTYFKVEPGISHGSVLLSCAVISHANMYLFQYTEFPITANSIWIQVASTKRKIRIEGLQSGKQYAFRVAGAGSNPTRIWSDEVKSYVI